MFNSTEDFINKAAFIIIIMYESKYNVVKKNYQKQLLQFRKKKLKGKNDYHALMVYIYVKQESKLNVRSI